MSWTDSAKTITHIAFSSKGRQLVVPLDNLSARELNKHTIIQNDTFVLTLRFHKISHEWGEFTVEKGPQEMLGKTVLMDIPHLSWILSGAEKKVTQFNNLLIPGTYTFVCYQNTVTIRLVR